MLSSPKHHLCRAFAFIACVAGGIDGASAQLRLDVLAERRPDMYAHLTSARLNAGKPARLLVRNESLSASLPRVAVGDSFSLVAAKDAFGHPRLAWTPPKRLLLDEAARWIEVDSYREQVVDTALDEMLDGIPADARSKGAGVVIGIVDGGIDFTHPDLQHEDGSTRVAWFLDYASQPLGLHPELEQQYGCTLTDTPCAILSEDDINGALGANANDAQVTLPADRMGHGTHVASLAAGSGRANARYMGVAPEATLIVARISETNDDVQDADVLLATQFVYERADDLGLPAIVNLSLGGDFGPHDGSTLLEQALLSFLEVPGRALVVAAGNSASMFEAGSPELPGPFGIHTDVYVDGSERVTLLIPDELSQYEGDVFVWVDAEPEQPLEVGVRSGSQVIVAPVAPDDFADGSTEHWEALVSNQAPFEQDELVDFEQGVLVLLTGNFKAGETIDLLLRGAGTASLWVQSSGDLGAGTGSKGALFSAARRGGTITVPATAAGLIAVGATLNRATWPSRNSKDATLFSFTEQLDDTPGSVAFFSSLGPNQLGQLKPDILAPGALVIGAMAPSADPARAAQLISSESMFVGTPICDEEPLCAVVSDDYGVALGTSMAAPIVTGAGALLLAQDPELTQTELLGLLMTGVARGKLSQTTPAEEAALPPAPGVLDLTRTQAAVLLSQQTSGETAPSTETSWLTLGDAYVTPTGLLQGLLRTRDVADLPTEVQLEDLKLEVEYGVQEKALSRRAPGLFEFSVRADVRGNGLATTGVAEQPLTVSVRYKSEKLTSLQVPIALDLNALRGYRRPPPRLAEESGCSVRPLPTQTNNALWTHLGGALFGLAWLLRRSRQQRHRSRH